MRRGASVNSDAEAGFDLGRARLGSADADQVSPLGSERPRDAVRGLVQPGVTLGLSAQTPDQGVTDMAFAVT